MLTIPARRVPRRELPPFLLRKRVSLKLDTTFFVGAYTKVFLKLRGLTLDDLEFRIPDGPKAGVVSFCRDADFDPENPDVMLCIGYEPGTYLFQVVDTSTNIVMAEQKFTVTTDWSDEQAGPSLSFTGISESFVSAPAWGGGPAGPQNVNVLPATGTRRLAILLIDTADGRYSADVPTLDGIRTRWMDETINGVSVGGNLVSARQYYREVSYGNFDLSADIFGPVSLPNNWNTYFDTTAGKVGWPLTALGQAAITAGDSVINYNNYDTIIFVSEQATGSMNAWPYGWGGTFTTAEGNKSLALISMPREWGAGFRADRSVRATVIHELGHNLGLGDQYKPDAGRNVGNWDPMNTEDNLPHFSLAHRMMLGWVQPGWLKTYNFANGGTPVSETITLHPIEAGAPPTGRQSGIEVRLADGWNYYVEYRAGQSTHVGDRNLDTNNAVLVTDVDSSPGDAPISRPIILRVPNDSDGDGSVLVNGLDYRETDTTDPTFPTDFKMSTSGINGTKADVRVEYGVNSRPDPAIRPWPASPDRQWQSPDIEVQNARNLADPANWFNVPWAGNPNTVIARVKNNGNLAAPNVRVEFYVKNFNVGGAPETPLTADMQTIPAGGTVSFQTTWNPPGNGHYCLIVRIPGYFLPGPPPVIEMSVFNNQAQSNYDRFISASASPASREITFVEVGNPYDKPTRVFVRPGQSNPLYRTYVEHTSLTLEPGETRKVKVMFEYDHTNLFKTPVSLGKTSSYDTTDRRQDPRVNPDLLIKKFRSVPNRVGLAAFIDDPNETPPHAVELLSGAQVEVVTGRKTRFDYFYLDGRIGGRVVEDTVSRQPTGVSRGKVLLIFRNDDEPDKPQVVYEEAKLDWDGRFVAKVTEKAENIRFQTVQGYYVPALDFGDAYSAILERR
ncbi:CARDB domain-containing protein [Spirosoma utsteinense]|uniref:M6 family metalloprotease-like protein n=1 Tax=Spirosoma utsteinense TaxID=2585773 RepID=A0ABR6WF08_9BACT|nr:CARDB domain-containing protein [Spirosoma utsteinense]MBC3785675.1 M6 family metalloprotease-like protein [Spirosoma utsteinense]MBC3794590.1 M6 family metalloprotease-like protein [Spirosoma utsteinense]